MGGGTFWGEELVHNLFQCAPFPHLIFALWCLMTRYPMSCDMPPLFAQKKKRCGPSFFARFALVFSIPFSLWGLQVWSGGLGFIPHVFGGLCFCWKPHPAEFWFLASLKRKKKKRLGASNLSSDVSIIFLPHIWKVPLYFFWPIFWARPVSRESGGGFQGVLRQRPALQFTFISEPRGSNVEV